MDFATRVTTMVYWKTAGTQHEAQQAERAIAERGGAGERDDAPVLAIAFRHDGRAEAHDFRVLVVAEQERVFDAAMGIAVSLLPQS